MEKVSDKVIESADELKAIVFTGTGWTGFIPGHELATKKGIAVGAAPHLNAHAVAEFGVTMTLIMSRDAINLARGAEKDFETTRSLSELSIGVVGLGHVGEDYARMVKGLGVKDLYYYSRQSKPDLGRELEIAYVSKEELFKICDVVFVALSTEAGNKYIEASNINAMKPGSLLVSIADPLLFDLDALYQRLKNGDMRGAFDENIEEDRFRSLPLGIWYTPNESTAFNTGQTIEDVSNSCVETLINLLNTGADKYLMNPEYKSYL